jgi:YD repeat-containing protein
MWSTRTLADLAAVVQSDQLRTLDGVIASLEGGGGEGGEEHLSGPVIAGEGSDGATTGGDGGGVPGGIPAQGGWGNPGTGLGPGGVNTHTGNKLTRIGLVSWPSVGRSGVGLTLYHNSLGSYSGPFGPDWSHSYDVSIAHTPGSSAIVRWGNGLRVAYTQIGSAFKAPPGFHERLERLTDTNGATIGWLVTAHNQTRLEFGSHGLLTGVRDRWNNVVEVRRDAAANDRIIRIECPSGRGINFTYGEDGRIETIWAGDQNYEQVWYFDYSLSPARLERIRFSNPGGPPGEPTIEFGYDSGSNITSYRDRRGFLWTASYTNQGRCLWLRTPHTPFAQTSFAYQFTKTIITLPEGQQIDHNYAGGLLVSVRDPVLSGGIRPVEAYLYDSDRNVTRVTDRRGKQWFATYDDRGNLLTATNPLGKTTTYTFGLGNELQSVKRHGEPFGWTFEYHNGEVTSATDPEGRIAYQAQYRSDGELAWTKDAGGRQTSYDIDAITETIEILPPGLETPMRLQLLFGRLTSIGDAFNNTTTIEYDGWLRPRRIEYPVHEGGPVWEEKTYDFESNVIAHRNQRGFVTTYEYDPAGWLLKTTNVKNETEEYGYSPNGWLRQVKNGRGYVTTYGYSNRGERTSVTYPGTPVASESWSYDATGNVDLYTNGVGQTQDFEYDDAGRLIQIAHGSGLMTSYGYDDLNRLVSMQDATGLTTWQYDWADRIKRFVAPQGAVEYAYRPDAQMESMEDATGVTIYGYDPITGYLTSITNSHGETTTRGYDQGRLTWTLWHNGVREEYEYDAMSRVKKITRKLGSATLGLQEYGYDPAGNVVRHLIDGVETTYSYDAIDQLIGESRLGYSAGYTYDANGNRLT